MSSHAKTHVRVGTYRAFSYRDLKPNPLNPRRLFDEAPLVTLEESIRKNGILVPITVYKEKNGQHYIIDGERRWRCAEKIETDNTDPKKVPIPANIVDPPSRIANLLYMFNIHNLREQWDLMPTALSLKVVIDELGEADEKKLAELTQLSEPNVRRCKTLLSFPPKYYEMMLDLDPGRRIKANFFIELYPVLEIYKNLPARCRAGQDRNKLTDHFLELYRKGKIKSVINFRRILEAHDYLKDTEREDEFQAAAQQLAESADTSIRKLFDPLVAEDKSVATAETVCQDFLSKMQKLKIAHTTKRAGLKKLLLAIEKHVQSLLTQLEE
jgi:ParB/RepB/Spo0J family partition protein